MTKKTKTNELLQIKSVDNIVLRQIGEQGHAKRRILLRILTETNYAAKKQLNKVKFTDYHTHHRDDNSKMEAIKKLATETIRRAINIKKTIFAIE